MMVQVNYGTGLPRYELAEKSIKITNFEVNYCSTYKVPVN